MQKKTKRIIIIFVLVLLLIPLPIGFKDGGTVMYQAVLYRLTRYYSFMPIDQLDRYPSGFYEATAFSIFPFYIFGLELTFEDKP